MDYRKMVKADLILELLDRDKTIKDLTAEHLELKDYYKNITERHFLIIDSLLSSMQKYKKEMNNEE